jgi:hypothetical protein
MTSGTRVINPYAGSPLWAAIAATLIAQSCAAGNIRQFHPGSDSLYGGMDVDDDLGTALGTGGPRGS